MRAYLTARLLLAPLLVGQIAVTRKRVRVLPEATGPRQGRAGDGPLLRLLMIGDSSAAGVGAGTQDRALLGQVVRGLQDSYTVDFTLIAQSGARTKDARGWLRQHTGQYDVAVTALGINDVTKATTLPRFLDEQTRLWADLRQNHAVRHMMVSGMPPIGQFPALPQPLRWVAGERAAIFDRALRSMVAQHDDCEIIVFSPSLRPEDMSADGYHPGPDVYAAWGKTVAAQIRRRLADA